MLSGTPSTSFASGSSQHALRNKLLADWRQHQRNLCLRAQSRRVNTDLLMAPGDLLTMSDVDPTVAQLKRPAVQENCEGNGAGFH